MRMRACTCRCTSTTATDARTAVELEISLNLCSKPHTCHCIVFQTRSVAKPIRPDVYHHTPTPPHPKHVAEVVARYTQQHAAWGGRVMACAAGLMQCSPMSGLHLQLLNNSASCCKLMPATTTTRASKPRLRATASGRVRGITPTCRCMADDSNSAHTRTHLQPACQDSPSCDSGGTEVMAAAAARAAVAAVLLATAVIAIPMLQHALLRPANQPQ
jgi:hypothetical protein